MATVWRADGLRVKVDARDDLRPGFKFADHELRGVPVRVEVGPRDLDGDVVTLARRDVDGKTTVPIDASAQTLVGLMDEIQRALFDDAVAFRDANTREVSSYDELRQAVESGGFAVGSWCGDETCEQKVKAETKATIRFLPLEREDPGIPCTVCGNAGVERATWAVAY